MGWVESDWLPWIIVYNDGNISIRSLDDERLQRDSVNASVPDIPSHQRKNCTPDRSDVWVEKAWEDSDAE